MPRGNLYQLVGYVFMNGQSSLAIADNIVPAVERVVDLGQHFVVRRRFDKQQKQLRLHLVSVGILYQC